MSLFTVIVLLSLLYGAFRFLNICSSPSTPALYFRPNSTFIKDILDACPLFRERYVPVLLWGKNGHLHTAVCSLGWKKQFHGSIRRKHVTTADGTTVTFNIFEPSQPHSTGCDFTVLVCPGLCNNSESKYVFRFGRYLQSKGYRVVTLNHLGTLMDTSLTSPRIFSYGCTEEFHAIAIEIPKMYKGTILIAVGFSMGANIVVKYLGESPENQQRFLCGISFDQGYDISLYISLINHKHVDILLQYPIYPEDCPTKYFTDMHKQLINIHEPGSPVDGDAMQYVMAIPFLMYKWKIARFYMLLMTRKVIRILKLHQNTLFGEKARNRYGDFDLGQILSATSMVTLDEFYNMKVAGFSSVEGFHKWSSCSHYIQNVTIPLLIVNSIDDPLVPEELQEIPKKYVKTADKCLFVVSKFGGHLGYMRGGWFWPETVSWMDDAALQYLNAVIDYNFKAGLL